MAFTSLVFEETFTGPAGSGPDPSTWTHETGGGGWGNGERQTYVDDRGHSFLDGAGHLVIRAARGEDGTWRSARLTSAPHRTFTHGKVEILGRVPAGRGIWPAFWLLGSEPGHVWPDAGEIDVMETVDPEPTVLHQTVHMQGLESPHAELGHAVPTGVRLDRDWHRYGVEWTADAIRFLLDDRPSTPPVTPTRVREAGGRWSFDHPMAFVLNCAVGGTWPGDPDATTPGVNDLLVGHIRVWQ